ncbi:type IV pilus modification PilV family protein [Marinobacterium lutimaris]|uniref:General secretion pathway protein I n=1 Tax=Marinobacterium lutimaris TaxID=568106 RepID=A0A1H5WZP7_9GAMM|nr:prepilin-type N-terminal cleavage/methylation domain-containing protein [Marinobacterium lutimaris]SEG04951.1 general secretion pathway protein I [Marinobacterium lutimaris]
MFTAAKTDRQGGFTLLEVLVAFVIMAALLGVMLRLNSQALDTTQRAATRQQALMLAQSQLDRVLASPHLRLGLENGRFDDERFEWQLRVSRYEFPEQSQVRGDISIQPYEIELSVYWGQKQSLTLNTLRLVRTL